MAKVKIVKNKRDPPLFTGKLLKKFQNILQQHDFYKTLYSTTNLDCNDESFFNHNIKLTEEQKYLCEGNITFKECAQSLKLMTNGKSPGSDGYTVHF